MQEKFKELIDAINKNAKYCPWARKHTIDTYFKELEDEINELKRAIKNKDIPNIKEELGDVIWDVFMLAKIAECDPDININARQMLNNVIEKIKKRKPYIFENRTPDIEEARKVWQTAKDKEKQRK